MEIVKQNFLGGNFMQFNKYFKNIHEQYGFINFASSIAFIVFLLITIDYFNIFTLVYNKLSLPLIICLASFVIIKLIS